MTSERFLIDFPLENRRLGFLDEEAATLEEFLDKIRSPSETSGVVAKTSLLQGKGVGELRKSGCEVIPAVGF